MITIYHNGRCSKSRGALEILQEQNIPHEIRWYLTDPLSIAELKVLLRKLHLSAQDVIRKNEPLYKEHYKSEVHTEAEWIKILAENPTLLERPIVINGNKGVVARPPEKVLEIL
ncbi:MAG: arsenate reductase (glutaredoxin) [Taibaiella sp.]|nr:arsenate reductase (glutaredoxin) [Taibaiella sp.]